MIISEYVRRKVKIILSNNQFKQKLLAYRKTGTRDPTKTGKRGLQGNPTKTVKPGPQRDPTKPENRDPSGTLQNRKPGPQWDSKKSGKPGPGILARPWKNRRIRTLLLFLSLLFFIIITLFSVYFNIIINLCNYIVLTDNM